MKRSVKILCCLLVGVLLLVGMTGCENSIGFEEGKTYTTNFFELIHQEKYNDAAMLFHESAATTGTELQAYFEALERQLLLDFSDPHVILGFQSMSTNVSTDGGTCALTCKMEFGINVVKAEMELLRNEAGFGITNFRIALVEDRFDS